MPEDPLVLVEDVMAFDGSYRENYGKLFRELLSTIGLPRLAVFLLFKSIVCVFSHLDINAECPNGHPYLIANVRILSAYTDCSLVVDSCMLIFIVYEAKRKV